MEMLSQNNLDPNTSSDKTTKEPDIMSEIVKKEENHFEKDLEMMISDLTNPDFEIDITKFDEIYAMALECIGMIDSKDFLYKMIYKVNAEESKLTTKIPAVQSSTLHDIKVAIAKRIDEINESNKK